MVNFSVTRQSRDLIIPCEPTPGGTLALSWLDRYPTQRALIESLHVFNHGIEPGKVIKEALAKALVPYYPLAGRLVESDRGELEVACTGEGVWFIEAMAACSLEEADYLEHPFLISKDELVPHPRPNLEEEEEASLLFLIQVTKFTCGGFIVGFRFSHAISDGPGAAQFVTAIAEFARGLTRQTVEPIWCREAIPKPPKFAAAPPPSSAVFSLQYFTMDISLDYINHMKNQYITQMGQRCSTFDVLIAKTWQCRTQAIELDPQEDVHLCFAMSTLPLLKQVLPPEGGYYGNSYYIMKVTSSSARIVHSSIVEIVNLIKEAKKRLPTEFSSLAKGELVEDPYKLTTSYETLLVSDWTWLGFNDVDYGWGAPVHIVPLMNSECIATCIILKPAAPKQGARLMTQCVKRDHFPEFLDGMMNLA